jgi:hypothetical protein
VPLAQATHLPPSQLVPPAQASHLLADAFQTGVSPLHVTHALPLKWLPEAQASHLPVELLYIIPFRAQVMGLSVSTQVLFSS